MKKYIYNIIILLIGIFVLLVAVSALYTSIVLIDTGTTCSILLGILLIIVSTLVGGIGGMLISKFKLLD